MDCLCRLKSKYKAIDPEIRRFRWNWVIYYLVTSAVGISYSIMIPSLHQFVTSSPNPPDPSIEPGLGLSETWYSWIVSMASVGELMGAVSFGFLTRCLYTKLLLLVTLFLCFVGGLVYAVGLNGWMLLAARFVIGLFQGSYNVLYRSYFGETSETVIAMLPEEEQSKSKIKYTNFFITFMIGNSFLAFGPALSAIASQIPGLSQFRWPGGYLCIHSGLLFILVLVAFRDKKSDLTGKNTCGCSKSLYSHVGIFIFLLFTFFVVNTFFAVLETEENPILSDNFGLDIKYSSYIIMGSLVMYSVGTSLVYALQRCHVDNRMIFISGAVLNAVGAAVLVDWQVLGGDPCNQFNNVSFVTLTSENSSIMLNTGTPNLMVSNGSCQMEVYSPVVAHSTSGYLVSCHRQCMDTECLLLEGIAPSMSTEEENNQLLCFLSLKARMSGENVYCWWSAHGLFVQLNLSPDEGSGDTDRIIPAGESCSQNITYVVTRFPNTSGIVAVLTVQPSSTLDSVCELINQSSEASAVCASSQTCLAAAEENNVKLTSCISLDSTNSSNQTRCVCQAFSSVPGYSCFWNQVSRITGEYCERCPPTCLSEMYSLNFIQVIIGLLLFTPGFPFGRLTITLILSDIVGQAPQGLLMGFLVSTGSLARITGPLWSNQLYLLVGRRTWLVMSILTGTQLLVLVGFLLLYRKMTSKKVVVGGGEGERVVEEDRVELLNFEPNNENFHEHIDELNGNSQESKQQRDDLKEEGRWHANCQ